MNDFDFNPVEYADEVYGFLKSISKDSLAFDLTVSALKKALEKAEEETAEERRAAAVGTIEEALQSFFEADGEVTCYVQGCHETFHSFDTLVESMEFHEVGFNDGEEVY